MISNSNINPRGPIGSTGPMPPLKIDEATRQAFLSAFKAGCMARFLSEPDDVEAEKWLNQVSEKSNYEHKH